MSILFQPMYFSQEQCGQSKARTRWYSDHCSSHRTWRNYQRSCPWQSHSQTSVITETIILCTCGFEFQKERGSLSSQLSVLSLLTSQFSALSLSHLHSHIHTLFHSPSHIHNKCQKFESNVVRSQTPSSSQLEAFFIVHTTYFVVNVCSTNSHFRTCVSQQ